MLLYRRSSIFQVICFLYRIRPFVSELIEYACINTRNQGHPFERNYIIAKAPKRYKHGASFQSSPKINRMLITRLISINRIRGPTRSGKARHLSHFLNLSKAFFTKHAWRFGIFFWSSSWVKSRSYPQFRQCPLGTPRAITLYEGLILGVKTHN